MCAETDALPNSASAHGCRMQEAVCAALSTVYMCGSRFVGERCLEKLFLVLHTESGSVLKLKDTNGFPFLVGSCRDARGVTILCGLRHKLRRYVWCF